MILSESLRPALGDQLVDEFAIAGIVGERAAQLLGCGAASCGRGVGRVRRPGHGLIVAGGVAASRRFADAAGGDLPACRCLWLGRSLRARHPGSAVGGRSRPGKESVAKRSLACLTAMQQLGVLGGLLQVAREAADVPGDGRVRVAGENTMLRDARTAVVCAWGPSGGHTSGRREARTRWCGRSARSRLRGCRAGDDRDGTGPRYWARWCGRSPGFSPWGGRSAVLRS